MKKSALQSLTRDPGTWCLSGLSATCLTFTWVYSSLDQAVFWTLVYGFILTFVGYMLYRMEADRLIHAAVLAERQAKWDEEAERSEMENQILSEDHERRMLELRVAGRDPGPSGQAARILAERQARLVGHLAKDRMARKARIAARQATATGPDQRTEEAA